MKELEEKSVSIENLDKETLIDYSQKYLKSVELRRQYTRAYLEKNKDNLEFQQKRLESNRAYQNRNKEAINSANMVRYWTNPEYKEKKKLRARETYYERTKDMPRMKGGRKPKAPASHTTHATDNEINTDTSESMLSIKERLKATPKPVGRPRKYDNQKK